MVVVGLIGPIHQHRVRALVRLAGVLKSLAGGLVRAPGVISHMSSQQSHVECVESWLSRMERGGQVDSILLLRLAMDALWREIGPTLGAVTLSAIVSRVHFTAVAKFAALDEISVSENGVSPVAAPRSNALDDQAREGVRWFLVELLTVMGNLTAEILTPAIHAVLAEMTHTVIEPASRQRGPAQ